MNTASEIVSKISLVISSSKTDEEKYYSINKIIKDEDALVKTNKYTFTEIENQIFEFTGITLDEMNIKTRKAEVVFARQLAHYKAKKFTKQSLASIGFYFGRKDHATVVHSCKTINGLLEVDTDFKNKNEQFLNT